MDREQIGKVWLDYSVYPGEDFYSDGEIEDELLHIVEQTDSSAYEKVIGEKKNWPVLYHLSPLRENIVDWIPMKKSDKVLEVGSGCGAVTGAFARKAGSVTCVDLSKRRSLINAKRHADCDNITIHVGNFKDVEPTLGNDYDYICLIGVFEYAQSYIGGKTPFEDFLNILLPHLAPGGRIVIAIENKYGLKYFAGCREDHLGTFFSGIENYSDGGGVRTFSRKGLERIFANCGISSCHFYYPYPDYKFMTTVYSDAYLPEKGELWDNKRNFDRDRMLLFDEKNAFDGLSEDGMFSFFSNSFVAVLGEGFEVKYTRYSNDRAPEYAIKTVIGKDYRGVPFVRKYPASPAAQEHIRSMEVSYESLRRRYEGGRLKINTCQLVETQEELYAQFEYVDGVPLTQLFDKLLEENDLEGFKRLFREYVDRIGYHQEEAVADFDLIFGNILVQGEEWTIIDYEWTFGKQIPTKELAFRAIYYYFDENPKRNKIPFDWVLEELGISRQKAEELWEEEKGFQAYIRGDRVTLAQMRDLIGNQMAEPAKWMDRYGSGDVNRVQIYTDCGEGYKEEESYFVRDAYKGERFIEFSVTFESNVKMLRIDPAMDYCMVKVREMLLNGERVPLEKRKVLLVNGRIVKTAVGADGSYQPSLVFPTEDPNININFENIPLQEKNTLSVKLEIVRIPKDISEDMAAAVKKLI